MCVYMSNLYSDPTYISHTTLGIPSHILFLLLLLFLFFSSPSPSLLFISSTSSPSSLPLLLLLLFFLLPLLLQVFERVASSRGAPRAGGEAGCAEGGGRRARERRGDAEHTLRARGREAGEPRGGAVFGDGGDRRAPDVDRALADGAVCRGGAGAAGGVVVRGLRIKHTSRRCAESLNGVLAIIASSGMRP